MDVDDDNELVGRWLEEEVLHIAEKNIDNAAARISVSETILVDFDFA
jgi:hypothetical protein